MLPLMPNRRRLLRTLADSGGVSGPRDLLVAGTSTARTRMRRTVKPTICGPARFTSQMLHSVTILGERRRYTGSAGWAKLICGMAAKAVTGLSFYRGGVTHAVVTRWSLAVK